MAFTMEKMAAFVKAQDLADTYGDQEHWVFYTGEKGKKNIKKFQECKEEEADDGTTPISLDDVFSAKVQSDLEREFVNVKEIDDLKDPLMCYYFGLLASGTVHLLIPKGADVLKPYGSEKDAHWYMYELPAVLRKGGGVTQIIGYDAAKEDFTGDEGKVLWERADDHEGPDGAPDALLKLFEEEEDAEGSDEEGDEDAEGSDEEEIVVD